jgi:hypothetical protein
MIVYLRGVALSGTAVPSSAPLATIYIARIALAAASEIKVQLDCYRLSTSTALLLSGYLNLNLWLGRHPLVALGGSTQHPGYRHTRIQKSSLLS